MVDQIPLAFEFDDTRVRRGRRDRIENYVAVGPRTEWVRSCAVCDAGMIDSRRAGRAGTGLIVGVDHVIGTPPLEEPWGFEEAGKTLDRDFPAFGRDHVAIQLHATQLPEGAPIDK